MKRLFTILSLAAILSCVCLQASGKVSVYLTVRDSFRQHQAPDSITIKVYDMRDSLIHSYFRAVDYDIAPNGGKAWYGGVFGFSIKTPGKYRVKISAPGFVTKEHSFEVDKKNGNLKLGTFYIDKAIELKEVDIVASKVKMVMKGDTLVYNATAFQVADGSMLDKLIEQLPGAKIDGNGRITVNGEFIESLLINGKDFFSGNPSVALQNLPAYTVNQVQVYRKEGDAAYLTKRTEAEKKKDPLVMDVKLKKEFIGTYMANADVGYGTSKKYSGRAFLSRFDDSGSLSLFGNFNNMGLIFAPMQHSVYNAAHRLTDDITTRSGGVDYFNSTEGRRRVISTSLTCVSQTENNGTQVSSTNFMPDGLDYASRSRNASRMTTLELRYYGSVRFRLKKAYLFSMVGASFSKNNGRSSGESAMNLGDIFDEELKPGEEGFINRYFSASRSHGTSWRVNGEQQANISMPYNSDLLNLSASASHQSSRGKSWAVSNRIDSSSTSILNDHSSDPAHFTYVNAKASYEHEFPFGLKIIPGYSYDLSDSRNERMLDHFMPDSIMNQVPVYTDTISLIHDARQSFVTKTNTTRHSGFVAAEFTLGNVFFDINLPYTWITSRFSDTRAASATRRTGAFEPSASVYWSWFTAKYRTRKYMPSATQLLDYTDDSSLTTVRVGNPDLRNATDYQATLEFRHAPRGSQQQYYATGYYTETNDAFSNAVTFDPATGVSTIVTKNIDGNRNFGGSAGYSRVFGKSNRFSFNGSVRVDHNRSAAYASLGSGYTESIVHNTDISPSVSLSYTTPKFMLFASIAPNAVISRGNLESFVNTNAFHGTATLRGWVNLPLGFYLESRISYTMYRGYSDPAMNRSQTLWTAAVQNTFGKKKEWTARLEGYDLLGQLSGISRSVNAQGITETRRNLVGRFVMLHLQYRFSYSPKKK